MELTKLNPILKILVLSLVLFLLVASLKILVKIYIDLSSSNEAPIAEEPIAVDELILKLRTSCSTDSDCSEHIVSNQCRLLCANRDEINLVLIDELERTKTCDPTLWDPPLGLNCGCISNECKLTE